MAEYINRERARFEAKRYFKNMDEIQEDLDMLFCMLPAENVAPVKHGRWEVGYFHDRVCSCCLHPDNDFDDYAHNFCPNCGAKMRGSDDE